ncbi:MAG: hypothetical protein A2350_07210 [Candidatus Raymondbacteria bacterium RifOxyB12_full_50_8]|nr:MAG: hypothetical protein A2350_07210 [Candidatus Raymondbacteria bacterium RifOxyB12_full_50_8]
MYRYGKKEVANAKKIVASGSWFRYYGGKMHCHAVDEFEKKMKSYTGARYVLATSSCTGALVSALAAIGVGPQDEVIIPGYTFVATAAAVVAIGAVPVIAEIDETHTIDVFDIKRKITPRTKAIIPVHMIGFPCDMDSIMKLASEYNLMVIEDTAQAVGASYKGKILGTIGHIGCYSLQWHKIISSGEGGCLLTNDPVLYKRAGCYHDSAQAFRRKGLFHHTTIPGVNFRMSEITGAVASAQADRLGGIIADLRRVRKMAAKKLSKFMGEGFYPVPSHDPEGDAGSGISMIASKVALANKFSRATGIPSSFSNKAKDWHIYYYWDFILKKKSVNGKGYPWKILDWESPVQYSRDMCPNTLDILKRSFGFGLHPDMTERDVDKIVAAVQKGIEKIFKYKLPNLFELTH